MKKSEVTNLTAVEVKTIINSEVSKSNKIVQLFNAGKNVKEISELLNIRYNFAYNVISNYINVNSIEVIKEEKDTKKDLVVKMFLEGKKVIEISKELKTNYNYIHKIVKEYKDNSSSEISITK